MLNRPACWYPGEPYTATRRVTTGPRAGWPAEPGGAAGPGPEQLASVPATAAMAASAAIRGEMCIAAPGREETSEEIGSAAYRRQEQAGSGNDRRRVAMKFSRYCGW